MKVRNDFVSNSSSCSFIINAKHISKACKVAYDKLYELEVPYDIDQDITVRLYAKFKNVDKLFKTLFDMDMISDKLYYTSAEYDPEEISYDSVALSIGQFIELAKHVIESKQLCNLIDRIEFESDDYGSGPMNLRDFYDFFDKNKCKPNAENSEHEFTCEDETDFRSALKGKRK